jgi:allantoinase
MIEAAKREGLPLTVETCPHYLLFNDQQISNGDTRFKCAPPIRDESNRRALCDAVSSGLIDSIGSDHSPCPESLKCLESGDFQKAWGGIAGLQLTLPAIWTVGFEFNWTPAMLADRCSSRPAEIFGLSHRTGRISPGLNADFVVWDPASKFVVDTNTLFHRHPVSPYDGHCLHGVTHRTYVQGQLVYDGQRDHPRTQSSKPKT